MDVPDWGPSAAATQQNIAAEEYCGRILRWERSRGGIPANCGGVECQRRPTGDTRTQGRCQNSIPQHGTASNKVRIRKDPSQVCGSR